jgi:anti-sigma B factor antagonist
VPGAGAGHAACMTAGRFSFTADPAGDTTVVRLLGELDMAATFRLEPELERLSRDGDVAALVIDLEGVEFMDSSGLGLLLATQQRLGTEGVRFVLANPSDSARRMLQLTGVADALTVTAWPPAAPRP